MARFSGLPRAAPGAGRVVLAETTHGRTLGPVWADPAAFASPDFVEASAPAWHDAPHYPVARSEPIGPRLVPSRRKSPLKAVATVAMACLSLLVLWFGVGVLAAARPDDPPLRMTRFDPLSPPQWIDIVRPFETYSLDVPELARDEKIYRARRNREGGGRQDILGFGQLRGKEPFLSLMVYRIGNEAVPEVSFYVDLARRAAATDFSIRRSLQPQVAPTRFGPFEVADLDLVEKGGPATACLGFRSIAADAPIKLSGFACGTPDKPLSRAALLCFIERLDLNSAAEDPALVRFFAASELKRNPTCAGVALGPKPVHPTWGDQADAQPQLRSKKTR